MPCGLTPNQVLPRRYVLRAGVTSPLTCRHPKHVRCSCHGQPAEEPRHKTQSSKAAEKATAEARRQHDDADDTGVILAKVLFTIRSFPEAAEAVSRMLKPGSPPDDETPGRRI